MTRIGLLGDVHGNANVALAALNRFKSQGIEKIVQVGDWGFWPGKHGSAFLAFVQTLLNKNDQTLYITPGNHEDYTYLRTLWVNEDGWAESRGRIMVAPRGHRWEWDGVSFVSLGGAPSVDRTWRLHRQRQQGFPLWWPEEDITVEDMDKTMAGGRADVMIAHDAPMGVPTIEMAISGNPGGFTVDDRHYADQGRQKMLNVVDVVRPKLFFGGHYHFHVDETIELFNENTGVADEVRVCILAADGYPYSMGVLDLPSLRVEFWK